MTTKVSNYDMENDVLYINFHDPALKADDTQKRGDFIFRPKEGKQIGATITNYTKYENIIRFMSERPPLLFHGLQGSTKNE